ncbi:hypothetical protein Sfulv_12970 [Streptomyces fulvorobeus]|uniref:Uncharacterized protein n=1 Tax=Streptomyces fulvorobeus TaxID=284028 RepID=A0A7J0C429_9ACTN|nr:hypothetical protein Sfulv_12970 [Streptomyces fulvorobeus]
MSFSLMRSLWHGAVWGGTGWGGGGLGVCDVVIESKPVRGVAGMAGRVRIYARCPIERGVKDAVEP